MFFEKTKLAYQSVKVRAVAVIVPAAPQRLPQVAGDTLRFQELWVISSRVTNHIQMPLARLVLSSGQIVSANN